MGKRVNKGEEFESTSSLMGRLKMSGLNVLVRHLPLDPDAEKKKSLSRVKIIGAEEAMKSMFNFGRGVVISRGSKCVEESSEVGTIVYFGINLSVQPNYPNPKKGDDAYSILSEGNITYYE